MAEHRPGGEATEAPTPKRRHDARKRGEVAKSRDVVSAAVFAAVCAAIAWTWPEQLERLSSYVASVLATAPGIAWTPQTPAVVHSALGAGLHTLSWVVLPIVLVAAITAVLASYAQVGSILALEPIKPKLARLHPLTNLKNIFSTKALFELLKSMIKVVGFGAIAAQVLYTHAPQLIATVGQPPDRVLGVFSASLLAITVRLGILAVLLAALDLAYQRFTYGKRMRMTKQEVKREMKDAEGDPQRKAERQRVHRELLEEAMLAQVQHADCVVINPTQIAVAIRYDEKNDEAPRVVARGQRLMAARIRELARQHGVPIVRNVPLARALVDLELDDQIPPELYEVVAEVLRFVYTRRSPHDRAIE